MNPSIVNLIFCHNRCLALFVVPSLSSTAFPSFSLPSLIPNYYLPPTCTLAEERKTTTGNHKHSHFNRERRQRRYKSYTRIDSTTGLVEEDFDISGNRYSSSGRLNQPIVTGGGAMYRVKTDDANNKQWIHVSFDEADDTTASFAQQGKGQKKRKGVNSHPKPVLKQETLPPSQLHDEDIVGTTNNKSIINLAQNESSTQTSSSKTPITISISGSSSSSSSGIPESVLQYERQMRKLRASDRASKTNVNIHDHLHTVHVDEQIVVVNKPSGILCVPGVNGHRSMLDLVYDVYGHGSSAGAVASGAGAGADSASAGSTSAGTNNVAVMSGNEDEKRPSNIAPNDIDMMTPPLSKDSMIVHRLDMDTSGIVIFARTRTAMAKLHESFRDRTTGAEKVYEALLVGWLEIDKWIDIAQFAASGDGNNSGSMFTGKSGDKDDVKTKLSQHPLGGGMIHLPLQRDHKHPPFMRVSTPESEAEAQQAVLDLNNAGYAKLMAKRPKPSTTQFHILSHELWMGYPVTRVQLLPITGRTHQLRVHCAALGHPILGDPAYGYCGEAHAHGGFDEDALRRVSPTFASFDLRRDVEKLVRESGRTMCLHARKLTLDHPVTKERVSFEVAPTF